MVVRCAPGLAAEARWASTRAEAGAAYSPGVLALEVLGAEASRSIGLGAVAAACVLTVEAER